MNLRRNNMGGKRSHMSRGRDHKSFSRTAGNIRPENASMNPMRGGYRL